MPLTPKRGSGSSPWACLETLNPKPQTLNPKPYPNAQTWQWIFAMGMVWRYAETTRRDEWKGLTWGMLPLHARSVRPPLEGAHLGHECKGLTWGTSARGSLGPRVQRGSHRAHLDHECKGALTKGAHLDHECKGALTKGLTWTTSAKGHAPPPHRQEPSVRPPLCACASCPAWRVRLVFEHTSGRDAGGRDTRAKGASPRGACPPPSLRRL